MITVKELKEKIRKNDYDVSVLTDEDFELFNRVDALNQYEGKLVKHFKGKFYLVLGVVKSILKQEKKWLYIRQCMEIIKNMQDQ